MVAATLLFWVSCAGRLIKPNGTATKRPEPWFYQHQMGSAQSQISFEFVFLDGREWLAPRRVFSPLYLQLTSFKNKCLYIFA
jgi:hypothetical protein